MKNLAALTTRQARFVQEYMVDGCGAQAAIRAGIAPTGAHVWASRTLRIAKVSELLQARQAADATRLSMTREDALQGLLAAVALAKEQANPMAMVSGWREIAKMLGFYTPEVRKIQMSSDGAAVMRQMEAMSDAELLAIVEAD